MHRVADTRDRLITATLELFRRQGYAATSLSQVTEAAGAPAGSLYHHFKGGKEELAEAVLTSAGAIYLQLLEAIWDAEDNPVSAVATFFDAGAVLLEETDFIDPCPVGTIAREVANTNEVLRATANNAFESWIAAAQTRLVDAGLDEGAATGFAITLVAGIEGGFVLARTARNADLLRSVGHRLAGALEVELKKLPTKP